MTQEPPSMTPEEIEAMKKLLSINASHAAQRFTDLAATWGLGGLRHQLDELVEGLVEHDRPEVATNLVAAIDAYLEEFGPKGVVGQSDTYRDHA
ncbi:hypothetical protein ABIB25_003175 [Nakamurella sp. UYEF19]|uniref:hypothetical protein n=1 Tax=Nakamurella sp. UYEF19 TaxID=1756392 RepID=UPI003399B926